MGNGAGTVLNYARSVESMKCLDGAYDLCLEAKRLNPELIIVARTLQTNYGIIDCPQEWNYGEPSAWWGAINRRLPDGFDYYEIQNECYFPPQGPSYYARWSIEMAKLVQRDKGAGMLAFSFSPGNPDYPSWPLLLPYLQWADQNPLPNGRRHGIALHASAYAPWTRADSPWIGNRHINPDRYFVFVRDVVKANTGVDILSLSIPVVFSEIGVTDGYGTGIIYGGPTYTCQERASAYRYTAAQLEGRGMMNWWNIGQIGPWTSDHECLPEMFK